MQIGLLGCDAWRRMVHFSSDAFDAQRLTRNDADRGRYKENDEGGGYTHV